MPLRSGDIKSAIMSLMPVLTEMILANLGRIEATSEPDQPNEEEHQDDRRDDRRKGHHARDEPWDTMTRDGHGRVRPTKEYSSRTYQRAPIDHTTKVREDKYRENWPTVTESRRDTVYIDHRRQDTAHPCTEPDDGPQKRETRPTRSII